MAARKSLGGAGLPPLADLFSTSDERALEAQTQERVMMLSVSELHDFPGHPFRVRDDEEMEKLAESITQHGLCARAQRGAMRSWRDTAASLQA